MSVIIDAMWVCILAFPFYVGFVKHRPRGYMHYVNVLSRNSYSVRNGVCMHVILRTYTTCRQVLSQAPQRMMHPMHPRHAINGHK